MIMLLALAAAPVYSADPPPQPVTTSDPAISLDALNLSLKPLTKDDLTVELGGWIGLLKKQVSDISALQIKALGAEGPAKDQMLGEVAKLQEKRTALMDRVKAVISASKAKGIDTAVQDKYLDAVSGIEVKPTDAAGALTLVQNWLTSPEGGLRWLRNIALFLATLFVFNLIANGLGSATDAALTRAKSASDLLKSFLVNVVRKVTWIIGLVVALSMLEIDIGPLVAAIGATGFVVGFALQNTLGNFAAGIMLLLYRPFDIGHSVTVAGGTEGTVKEMTLVSTTLKTADGHLVVVPNSAIWGAVIVNKDAS
jgi:small conductance mechanosensitive channel